MTKKSLIVAPAASLRETAKLDLSAAKIGECHMMAMRTANLAVAFAVFAGLELQAVKATLKKSATGCTFDDWLEANVETLGFSRRTAFNYTKMSEGIKPKLAKQFPQLASLLAIAPSDMSDRQTKELLQALNKSVDGQSLTALYQDFGIIKLTREEAITKALATTRSAPSKPVAVPIESRIHDQLLLPLTGDGGDGTLPTIWKRIDDVVESWNGKVEQDGIKAPLWSFMDEAKKRRVLEELEVKRAVTVTKLDNIIAQLRESLGKKK